MANLENTNRSYFLKHLVIIAVLFFFFTFERFMKILAISRAEKFKEKRRLLKIQNALSEFGSIHIPNHLTQSSGDDQLQMTVEDNKDEKKITPPNDLNRENQIVNEPKKPGRNNKKTHKSIQMDLGHVNLIGVQQLDEVTDQFVAVMKQKEEDDDDRNNDMPLSKSGRICCTSLSEGMSHVRPIGWMAIFGDGLGNFIDGLSIGASISQNIVLGLTTGFATWCGNIPQELGDFALLVRAGMTPFQALFYNWLSANSVYIGCAIGIIFGSDLESARWIFAVSGATSLYLGLAVLLPEMKNEFDESKDPISEKLKITYIQLLGMLTGITLITILNMYEDEFQF